MRAVIVAMAIAVAACARPMPPIQAPPVTPSSPAPGSVNDLLSRPWQHVGYDVSREQFQRTQYKCKTIADLAPPGAGDPGYKMLLTFFNCMRAEGYEPVPR